MSATMKGPMGLDCKFINLVWLFVLVLSFVSLQLTDFNMSKNMSKQVAKLMAKEKNSNKNINRLEHEHKVSMMTKKSSKTNSSSVEGALTALSVAYPELIQGTRIPDPLSVPTSTGVGTGIVSFSTVYSNSVNMAYLRFTPSTKDNFWQMLTWTGATGIIATADLLESANDAFIQANASLVRVVGMSYVITTESSVLNVSGVWYAATIKNTGGSTGTLVGQNVNAIDTQKYLTVGKLTADEPSFRVVWMPGDEGDREMASPTSQLDSDSSVLDVKIIVQGTTPVPFNVRPVILVEYIASNNSSQGVMSKAVVADPSTYAKYLNQIANGIPGVPKLHVNDPQVATDPGNFYKIVNGLSKTIGDASSGNLLGAVRDIVGSAGDIMSGIQSAGSWLANAASSLFGVSSDTDQVLRHLMYFRNMRNKKKAHIISELDSLCQQGKIPKTLLSHAVSMFSALPLDYEYDRACKKKRVLVRITEKQASLQSAPLEEKVSYSPAHRSEDGELVEVSAIVPGSTPTTGVPVLSKNEILAKLGYALTRGS